MNLKLGRIFGTEVQLNWSLVLLLFLFIQHSGFADGLQKALIILGSILVHEFAHIFAARKFGIKTGGINLNFFGGAANVQLNSQVNGKQEALIALAGPASSLCLGLIGLGLESLWANLAMLSFFAAANITIAIFNMVPAFPLDGGRVVRGLLRLKFSYLRATQAAAMVGVAVFAGLTIYSTLHGMWSMIFFMILITLLAVAECKVAVKESRNSNS